MSIHRLKVSEIRRKPDGSYSDGAGLYLVVRNGGKARSWIFRYGKDDRHMGLGSLDKVSLAEARETVQRYWRMLREGKDPLTERMAAKLEAAVKAGAAPTVNDYAEKYLQAKIAIRSPGYRENATRIVRNYIMDTIGTMPIHLVNTDTILQTVDLRRLWYEKHPTGYALHNHLKRIFSMAKAEGKISFNPAAWADHLEHILASSGDVHKTQHYPSLPYQDVGRFMQVIRAYQDRKQTQGRTSNHMPMA